MPHREAHIALDEICQQRELYRMCARTILIEARLARGYKSRAQFAKAMGVSRHYIHYVETGTRDPSFALMKRWIETLGGGATLDLFDNRQRAA
jgi:transcriptional regulator with XRE-family HTH domain